MRTCGMCGSTTAVREYDEHLDVCEECLLEEPPKVVERPCPRCGGGGYHYGFGEHGHDPDWCEFCGGPGVVFEEEGG